MFLPGESHVQRSLVGYSPWCHRESDILKRHKSVSQGVHDSKMSLVILSLIQYFGHMVWRTDSLEKDPDAGKYWRQEEKETTEAEVVRWHHQLDGHGFEQALYVDDDREAWCAVVHEVAKCWTQLSNWTELVLDHLAKEVFSRFIHSKVFFFFFSLSVLSLSVLWRQIAESAYTEAGRRWWWKELSITS